MKSLTELESALATYWFIIFSKPDLCASMSCLPPTQFSFISMYYYYNNQSSIWLINQFIESIINIHWITSIVFSLFILLSIFLVHTCENYLCSKIYLCFLFASRFYFYMISEQQFLHRTWFLLIQATFYAWV